MQTFKLALLFSLAAITTLGCASEKHQTFHLTPVTERGVCATVIMPGQTVPMHAKPGCPGGYSSLGGTIVDDQRDVKTKQEPVPGTGLITAPLAAAAYPIKKAEEAVRRATGQQESGSSSTNGSQQSTRSAAPIPPSATASQPPVSNDPQAAWERAQLEALEHQVAGRPPRPGATRTPATPAAGPRQRVASLPESRSLSIADELARLQAATRPEAAGPLPDSARAVPGSVRAANGGVADRVSDRDGDARPDHWEYSEGGQRIRELFDEDGDGHPDRTIQYDPETGLEAHTEEDGNLDGRIDSWIDYRNGELARVRRDTDYDGQPDHWSFYRAGQLTRQEVDLNGDGYRNRVAFFEAGRLIREREDLDGDGRTDRVTHYDELERIRQRDEDRDGDGFIDTRSLYEAGRLVRRELVSDELRAIETDGLETDEWSQADKGQG